MIAFHFDKLEWFLSLEAVDRVSDTLREKIQIE